MDHFESIEVPKKFKYREEAMEGGGVFDGSNMTVTLQNHRPPCSSDVLESLWISNSSPSFHGDSGSSSTSMANLEDVRVGNPSDTPFFAPFEKEQNCNANEDYDGCFYQPEKKRRLTVDQVRFLERNFEVENKLEPDRKVQLAEELGLQPRQVAIWFQNRRARCRTKQLEKDYDCLKASYDRLKADYDSLLKEKERFRNEVRLLKDKLLPREKENPNSEPIDFINQMVAEPQKQIPNAASENKFNEDASMAKSDSESHSSLLEPADSCHAFGSEQSDFSQGDEDELTRTLFPPLCFPKLEDECYNEQPENWNFPVEGQPSWLWPY